MKLYDCKVRLAGSVTNEVRKAGVTAAEIEVLRHMHGKDAVIDIKETGDAKRSDAEERRRLHKLYADPENNLPELLKKKEEMLRVLFGHARMPLPQSLEDLTVEEPELPEEPIEDAPAPIAGKRTVVAKKEPAPAFAE